MSKFIESSKHQQMTSAVTDHFFGNGNSEIPGKAGGKSFARGGSPDWNSAPMPFNAGTGVNYTPKSQAGHTTGAPPFSVADGIVHGKTGLDW